MSANRFSGARFMGLLIKEFIQIRRDRVTFAMMVGIPIFQLVLFGFAINVDPKALPTAVRIADPSPFARSIVSALENSSYFRIVRHAETEAEVDRLLATGEVQFVISIPADFSRRLQRGERPAILLEADATDPAATGNALGALATLNVRALDHDLIGPLQALKGSPPPFEIRVHRRYNPEGITRYNLVPGLIGVVLTMTLVIMTALAVTRERERGTMESLLATPARPLEVMLGKIIPYIFIGYVQVAVILVAARLLFDVPMVGSLVLLSVVLVVFIAVNLTFGYTFSTVAKNQLQAMQMAMFFFLPSILLSGFMFPFRGMPVWAQTLGEALPLTHFLRIVRGVLLKGNGLSEFLPDLGALLLILAVMTMVALRRYQRTLD